MTRFAAGPRRGAPARPSRARPRSRSRSSRSAAGSTSARSTSSSSPSPIRSPRAARWRSARRPASSSIPATGRSTRRRRRRADRRARGCANSAKRACSRSICDSTNVLREGVSPSEADVAATSPSSSRKAQGPRRRHDLRLQRRAPARGGRSGLRRRPAGLVLGRAMERVVAVARECGYLDGVPPLLGPDPFDRLPRDKVLALATGSQGEPRAALARIADDEHPGARLAARRPRHLLLAHHPRQREGGRQDRQRRWSRRASRSSPTAPISSMSPAIRAAPNSRRLYAWLKPKIAVPAHGEPLHLTEHVAFARGAGRRRGGARVQRRRRAARRRAKRGVIGQRRPWPAATRTATILLPPSDDCVGQRRKLAFAGVVSIAHRL